MGMANATPPAALNESSGIAARQSHEPRDKWGSLF
jgi:hypothetical protein